MKEVNIVKESRSNVCLREDKYVFLNNYISYSAIKKERSMGISSNDRIIFREQKLISFSSTFTNTGLMKGKISDNKYKIFTFNFSTSSDIHVNLFLEIPHISPQIFNRGRS